MPKKHTKEKTPSPSVIPEHAARSLVQWLALIAIGTFVLITLIVGLLTWKLYRYVTVFSQNAQTRPRTLIAVAQQGWQRVPKMVDQRTNILLLGTDEVANRQGDPLLTDTMMLFSLDTETGQLSALSLPRDLWSEEYQTKINALYWYGRERNPQHPEIFTAQVLTDLTKVPIHYTMVLSLETVADLIDIVGGLEVSVPKGFIDENFPRADVDIRTEKDPAVLYETVEFQQGVEKMTGDRALKYMRSRKSPDLETGTDDARSFRQQQVIAALLQKMKDPSLIYDPATVGKLYRLYDQQMDQYFPITDVIGLGRLLGKQLYALQFSPSSLSIQSPLSDGVLYHPPISKYDQWVYEITDRQQFQDEVWDKLQLSE